MNPPALRRVPANSQTRAAFPEAQAAIPETDQPHNLLPWLIDAAIRMEANRHPQAASPEVTPGLMQLSLGKAHDLPVVNPGDPRENRWTDPRCLGRLLTKFGYCSPLAAAAYNPGSRRLDRHQVLPPTRDSLAMVREACNNFLKYAQEQHPPLGQVKSDADRLVESNHLGYCFPVAPPFSFRDTWGERRSGDRYHQAVDIFAGEGTPVYAITSGVIHKLAFWPGAGITLLLRGQDGKGYGYMHLQGYAQGIVEGKTVNKGELIAYVGRTGLLWESAHLHLQVYVDHRFDRDEFVNPYGLLVQLCDGVGVMDSSDQKIARRRIPEVEVTRYGKMKLYSFAPRRHKVHQRSVEDLSALLTSYLLKKDYLTTPAKQIP